MCNALKHQQDQQGHHAAGWHTRLRWFGSLQKGVAALEFALVAPLVFLVLFAGIELGVMIMADTALERAANNISRMGRVVGFSEGRDCASIIRDELHQSLQGWVHKNTKVSVLAIHHPTEPVQNPTSAASYRASCHEADGQRVDPGALVVFNIGFDDPVFIGALAALGVRPLQRFERTLIVQNEP